MTTIQLSSCFRKSTKIKKMAELCEMSTVDSHRNTIRKTSVCYSSLPLGVGLFVALVVIISAFTLVQRKFSRSKSPQLVTCQTLDCVDHAYNLKGALNKAIEPCENFYEHVCGSWEPKNEGASSVQEDIYLDTVRRHIEHLEDPLEKSLPAQFFKLCMNTTEPEEEVRHLFRNFMKELHISWPKKPEKGVLPLSVLINLAVNWNMRPLFNIHVFLRKKMHLPRMISFHRGTIGPKWAIRQAKLEKHDLFEEYFVRYASLLGIPEPELLNISQYKADEVSVIEKLLNNDDDAEPKEYIYPISRVDSATPSIPAHLWLKLLNEHYHPTFNFTPSDIMYIEDLDLLRVLENITQEIPTERLMNVIGWTFVQKYSLLAFLGFSEAGILKYGSSEDYKNHKPAFCLENTHNLYGLLSIEKVLKHRFGTKERRQVDQLLHSVIENAEKLISNTSWIDQATKSAAIKKISGIVTELWPPKDVFRPGKLFQDYYKDFPNVTSSFFSSYLELVKKVRTFRGHEHFDDVYMKTLSTPYGAFHYSHAMNTAFLGLQALEPPMYYRNGTPAMNYGALGSYYASKIIGALDRQGVNFTDRGEARMWWSNETYDVYSSKVDCIMNDKRNLFNVFPLLPALEISYRAYRDVKGRHGTQPDLRLMTLSQYSEEQMFFMSYCYTLCSKNRSESHDCNYPLMNSNAFVQAFRCPRSSPMSPPRKCHFFS
ncbi:endothelin-converting enzyme 1-like isoform X2 [Ornithodoros turicata]|uniref:endothelin-converting enzyme 1-like isoform X2 n=1 Tax=Ornithodoros turicata TaxID=34597 RepID=UPI003139A5FF